MPFNCGVPGCVVCKNVAEEGLKAVGFSESLRDVEVTKPDGSKINFETATLIVEDRTPHSPKADPFYAEDYAEEPEATEVDWEAVAEQHEQNTHSVVYISGPMRGYPDHNYPAFNDAQALLEAYDYHVVNPAANFDGRMDLDQETYLRVDVGVMAEKCNAIYFLPGWQNSAGARLEWQIARSLGFMFVNPLLEGDDTDVSDPVEYESSTIVRNGERQQNYGHPNQDFQRTAGMWTAFLAHKLQPGAVITMEEMALMMGQLKMSRLASTPGHHDSIVDLIGYAICYDRLGEAE